MVIVAMSAMMMNNPTMKTMLKAPMSMMTTALHLDLQENRSRCPFSTVQVACIQRVLWSFTVLLPPPWLGCTTVYSFISVCAYHCSCTRFCSCSSVK